MVLTNFKFKVLSFKVRYPTDFISLQSIANINIVHYPSANAGGLQSQGGDGEAIVHLLQTIDNTGSGALRHLQAIVQT